MACKKEREETPPGDGGNPAPPPPAPPAPQPDHHLDSRGGNTVFRSGPLYLSSKGIGWTSWKKRWFILTRTSLVFFRSDPSAVPQKGEVNLILGGIDLNNSGSVVVKADKKLLTVLFPDGNDGRTFTLKAETLDDLKEWKTALESALAQAPNASLVTGQNGIFVNDQTDALGASKEKLNERQPIKSSVIGIPILLALEDVDGSPSFLEKALKFVEDHGVRVEGILRQAADVDDVEHRVQQYEHGKREFSAEEDPHVIADCVKYVLRELPSSPVPATCCNALVEACRTDRGNRINAMRAAICETFPEPNRRLLQRILRMMQAVASHKAENRMSTSAVAACMAPLLLRPLLSGDCEIETDFNMGGDGSIQLLKAAAAANHAQTIVITLLDEYDNIFGEGALSGEQYSDTEESGSEVEEATEDDESYEDDENDYESGGSGSYTENDGTEDESSRTCSDSCNSGQEDFHDDKTEDALSSESNSPKVRIDSIQEKKFSSMVHQKSQSRHEITQDSVANGGAKSVEQANNCSEQSQRVSIGSELEFMMANSSLLPHIQKSTTISNAPLKRARHTTVLGRTSAQKNLSMESIDFFIEDELEIQRLEAVKIDLENKIAEEIKGNVALQASLEMRKIALHERRLALERDVERLQEELQKEKEKRISLELGLTSHEPRYNQDATGKKAQLAQIREEEVDGINLEQVDGLATQLNQQRDENLGSLCDSYDWNLHLNLKDTQMDPNDNTNFPSLGRSTSKGLHVDEDKNGTRKQEQTCLPTKDPQRSLQMDAICNNNATSASSSANSSVLKQVSGRTNATNSKRSSTRNEGTNITTSALSKLTTRLNFLKERRSQITNELHNMDKGRSRDKSESQQVVKGKESDSSGCPTGNPEKSVAVIDDHAKYRLKLGKNRKSDGNVSYSVDKAPAGSDVETARYPRTNSR